MHGAILGVASPAANAILIGNRHRESSCDLEHAGYFSGPRTLEAFRRSAHLVPHSGAKSANEVAQIITKRTIR
jgi:hypothetical protein